MGDSITEGVVESYVKSKSQTHQASQLFTVATSQAATNFV